jgi:hypothetical protein
VADAAIIAALQTRLREREADVARLTAELSKQQSLRRESRGITIKHTKTGDDARHMMLIRRLDADTPNERSQAVLRLAEHLQTIGKDFNDLAEATRPWLAEAAQRPSKPKPVDWPEVKAAVERHAKGKTKVNMNAVLKAVHAEVPATVGREDQREVPGYVHRILRGLGFTASRSGLTYERAGGDR